MKLNKIALAIVAAATAAPMAVNAGVTVTPVLLGYHYTDLSQNKQRENLLVGETVTSTINPAYTTSLNGGVAQDNGLYTAAALGIELTPSTQLQVEYGVSNAKGTTSVKPQATGTFAYNPRFDVEQENIVGNLLVGTDQFSGYNDSAIRPYVLVGGGQSKTTVTNRETYRPGASTPSITTQQIVENNYRIPAGSTVAQRTDYIANAGLGAMIRVNDALSIRGEGRAVYNIDQSSVDILGLGGLEVALGGHLSPTIDVPPVEPVEIQPQPPVIIQPVQPQPPVVVQQPVQPQPPVVLIEEDTPQPVDSDGDGVIDRLDACPNTPLDRVVDERGCPIPIELTEELQMELRVFFDNDKSNIKPQYQPEIAKVAEKMREYPNSTARIEGHASKTGPSARYNQRLSEARAKAVQSTLTNQYGITPNRLSTVGYGYTQPIASNDTEEGRALNRRVFAVITGSNTVTVEQTKDMVVE